MSASDTQHPHNALSGSYKELHLVENLGTTDETMTPVGNLYDDFELSLDSETVEINPSDNEFTIQFDTHKTIEASFTNFYTAPEEVLDTLGLINADNEFVFGVTHEAARLLVYDRSANQVAGPTDAIECIEMPEFNPDIDTLNYPEGDVINFDFTATVNDRPQKVDPTTL